MGDRHHSSVRSRRMLGSPTATSASGPSSLGSASSPLIPAIPNSLSSSPSQPAVSKFTASRADHSSRKSSPYIHPHAASSSSTSATTPTSPCPNNPSPRIHGHARVSSSPRHPPGSPKHPTPSVTVSPSIAARNARRLSAPSTPLFKASPSHRGQQRPMPSSTSNSPARRNSNRLTSPPAHPQPPQHESISSPPRRQKVESHRKLLPPLYQHCDTADLVVLISDMLGELVVLNDQIPLSTGKLTRFHSR